LRADGDFGVLTAGRDGREETVRANDERLSVKPRRQKDSSLPQAFGAGDLAQHE
jgi:hypothetical protein